MREAEVLVDELLPQRIRICLDFAEAQVRLEIVHLGAGQHALESGEELRYGNVDWLHVMTDAREVHAPIELRRLLRQSLAIEPVVHLVRVAALDARHRCAGQVRLDAQDGVRLLLRVRVLRARQFEHVDRVFAVTLARLLHLRIVLQVVVAVGEAEPALVGEPDHLRCVLRILNRLKDEEAARARLVEVADYRRELLCILDSIDRGEPLLQRL